MSGRDVIGIAQTGTGKTAAFALPILHHLAANPRPPARKSCRVLVLSPTRELSGQILDSFRAYGRHLRIRAALAIGGVPMGAQVRALLNGVDVLVATPGRLLDLVKSNALRLGGVEFLVLDEADRMLDMGFIHDIRKIVAKLPAKRQTLMFSATMPRAIAELATQMLRDPINVAVTPEASTVERVEQRIIHVDRAAKPAVLIDVLQREAIDRALIFTRTKHGADKVVRGLIRAGIAAEAIHGNKSQGQRERVLAAFRKGEVRILVATDIAARGIDVDGISHVVTSICRTCRKPMCIASAAPRARVRRALRSRCAMPRRWHSCAISRRLIRMSIPATDNHAHSRRAEPPIAHRHSARPAAAAPGKQQQGRRVDTARKQRDTIIRPRQQAVSHLSPSCIAMPRRGATRSKRAARNRSFKGS